jgi:4-diphosphocytidyl-2-C-methyl-D-erythritol kinase
MNHQIKSFAKINLGLKVLNKRDDDFHNINSIFIQIDLHDTLNFIPSKKFSIECDNNHIPTNHHNTIYKAYNILDDIYSFNNHYTILLNKKIPIESGLGGGSSNAAATLMMLNKIHNLNLNDEQLMEIGIKIGSDVPFFIQGGCKSVSGRGEIINEYNFPNLKTLSFLLFFPKFSISTSWAYKKIKNNLDDRLDSTKFPALDEVVDWKLFENSFEKVVGSAYPEILEIKELIMNTGALYSSLSGSGSTMFGVYNKEFIKEAKNKLNNYNTLIVLPT